MNTKGNTVLITGGATAAINALEKEQYEVTVGQAQGLRMAAAEGNEAQLFQNMNRS